ncbi:MAG: hypothetical protein GQ583_03330 [Methyloprofundus sp.]|nr:hypothetical protein [Methyloprofundus sp.]
MINWLQAVLNSHYISSKYKRKYAQQLYSIQMINGMPDEALKTILKAISNYGRAFQYFLMHADALQALGRYQEALAVLREAEMGVRGQRPELLRQVQQMQRVVLLKYRQQHKPLPAD